VLFLPQAWELRNVAMKIGVEEGVQGYESVWGVVATLCFVTKYLIILARGR
jgi:hypothetical protein